MKASSEQPDAPASPRSTRDRPPRSDRPTRTHGNPNTAPDVLSPNASARSTRPLIRASTGSCLAANPLRAGWSYRSDTPTDTARSARTKAPGDTFADPALRLVFDQSRSTLHSFFALSISATATAPAGPPDRKISSAAPAADAGLHWPAQIPSPRRQRSSPSRSIDSPHL